MGKRKKRKKKKKVKQDGRNCDGPTVAAYTNNINQVTKGETVVYIQLRTFRFITFSYF
jgi:hypothetical protein